LKVLGAPRMSLDQCMTELRWVAACVNSSRLVFSNSNLHLPVKT